MLFSRSILRAAPKAGLRAAPAAARAPLSRALVAPQHARSVASFTLNNGVEIPAVGIGAWQDKDQQEQGILHALLYGYRHIDAARIYGTEPQIARALSGSGINRTNIFLTTKLWNNSHEPTDVEPALNQSLDDLETDYVDLFLMHFPSPFLPGPDLMPKNADGTTKTGNTDFVQTYLAMEEARKKGKARAIGVSNFSKAELERLISETGLVPAVHQLELHPYLQQKDFIEWHKQKGIHVTQYSPFGNQNAIYSKGQSMDKLIEDPVLVEIGQKYNRTGAQVALAWGIAQGHSVIPKSKTPERIEQNFDIDFELSPEDLQKIAKLDKKIRFNDPSKGFGYNLFADLEGKDADKAI